MPGSSFEFIQHESQGLCFDPTIFLKDSFSIDDFLRSHRNQTTLEVLRDDLGTYLKTLRMSMIELINRDYEDFVNLSKDLVGLNAGIEILQSPLEQVRSEIVVVKTHLDDTIQGLKACLEEEKTLRERRQRLFYLGQVIASLKKVALLLSEEDSLLLPSGLNVVERVASEFTILQFSAARCLPIMSKSQKDTCEKLEATLMDHLNKLFLQSLRSKESSRLLRCLRMFVNLDKVSEAEAQVRKDIVGPFLYDLICESSLLNEPEGLRGIYRKVLQFIDTELSPLLELPMEEGAQFNFLLNSLWVELARRMLVQMSSVFSAGDPKEFHTRYLDSTQFLNELEKRLQNPEWIVALKNHPQTIGFKQKWNLLVYFKIRFQEIAGRFESKLIEFPATVMEGDNCKINVPAAALMCLERCWDDEVYLPNVAHLLWKLALQIQARYCNWVKEEASRILMPDQKDQDEVAELRKTPAIPKNTEEVKSIRLNHLISLFLETKQFKAEASAVMLKAMSRLPLLPDLQNRIEETLSANDQQLTSVLNLVSDSIVALLVKQSVPPLVHVHDIPRIFRRTNREFPTKPCDYVQQILKPVTSFYTKNQETVPNDVLKFWVIEALKEISRKFYNSISEVLESAQKTEESLRRLKKVKDKSSSGADNKGVSDDDKIRQQFFVDVQTFCQAPTYLQLDASDIPMLNDLYKLVENAREKSERQ